jgi:hypothetical protein
MSTGISKSESLALRVTHWAGCIAGATLIVLFAAFAVGLGLPPLGNMNASFIAIAVMLIGFALTWWRDLAGAVVSLVGISAFYALEFAANGHAPGGWLFPLCFVPGVLGLLSWLSRRLASR